MSKTPLPRYRADRDSWFAEVGGRRVQLAKGKRNHAAARKALTKILAERESGRAPRRDCLVGELCERRLDRVIRDLSPRTARGTKWYLNQFTKAFGRTMASAVTPHAVNAWLDKQGWEKRTKREPTGWSPQTKHNAILVIKAAFAWGVKEGLLTASPLASMARPTIKARPLCVGRQDLARILPWVRSAEFADYLCVLSATGARPSEIARLEADHLNPETMTAVMDGKTTRKTGRRRIIYFPADAWAIVARKAKERPSGPLFLTEDGRTWEAFARSTQCRAIRERARKAGAELPRFDS